MVTQLKAQVSTLSTAKRDLIANIIAQVRKFQFCGPTDDPDKQTAVTTGYRHLVIQLQRLAAPILPEVSASRLNAVDVDIDNLYSVYDAHSEVAALLPDIESALEALDKSEKQRSQITAKPLPVPVCSIVGSVLGDFVFHHKTLESLFYQAGAVGEVPLSGRSRGGSTARKLRR
jgi:hypothetical protein